jgi:hypothetical protein
MMRRYDSTHIANILQANRKGYLAVIVNEIMKIKMFFVFWKEVRKPVRLLV